MLTCVYFAGVVFLVVVWWLMAATQCTVLPYALFFGSWLSESHTLAATQCTLLPYALFFGSWLSESHTLYMQPIYTTNQSVFAIIAHHASILDVAHNYLIACNFYTI